MAFVHYRSPEAKAGHRGESLRTRSVADAWSRLQRFLASCTDNPPPRSALLRVDHAVDDDGSAAALAASITLGEPAEWRSNSGDEQSWEWAVDPRSPAALEELVATCAAHETRPRIHVNAAVRSHDSPKTPQVWATLAYEIALRCGVEDRHVYQPGWGQSQVRVYLCFNEIWLVLHFPFTTLGPELEAAVSSVDAALDHRLVRDRLRLFAR